MTAIPGVRPILFSGSMIRAIQRGTKTMTRRIVNARKNGEHAAHVVYEGREAGTWLMRFGTRPITDELSVRCPYGVVGDRLWVRETFAFDDEGRVVYGADPKRDTGGTGDFAGPWKPSIHMPRSASRLTLQLTAVRMERLQDICESDAQAEGAQCLSHFNAYDLSYHNGFVALWDRINRTRAPWTSNPWVWVVSFERIGAAMRDTAACADGEVFANRTLENPKSDDGGTR